MPTIIVRLPPKPFALPVRSSRSLRRPWLPCKRRQSEQRYGCRQGYASGCNVLSGQCGVEILEISVRDDLCHCCVAGFDTVLGDLIRGYTVDNAQQQCTDERDEAQYDDKLYDAAFLLLLSMIYCASFLALSS